MISLHYTSHTKAYNTIYTACNIAEAIYSFTYNVIQCTITSYSNCVIRSLWHWLPRRGARSLYLLLSVVYRVAQDLQGSVVTQTV